MHIANRSSPGQSVFKRWMIGDTDHGVCKGQVRSYDYDRSGPSDRPWLICWEDGGKSYFDIQDMLNYCINHTHGSTVTQVIPDTQSESSDDEDTIDSVTAACEQKRSEFDSTSVHYYSTKDDDTWHKVCTALDIPHGQRKLYYQWLREHHKYGHSGCYPFKFINPYGSSRKTSKFIAGVPFPSPNGGAWDALLMPDNNGDINVIHMVNHLAAERISMMKARQYDFPADDSEAPTQTALFI